MASAKREDDPDVKAVLLLSREVALQKDVLRADQDRLAIEQNLLQLANQVSSQLSVREAESRDELLQEVRRQAISNELWRKACDEAIAQLSQERTGHKIKGTIARDNSNALAGMFNVSGEAARMRLDISDTVAEGSSFAGAGVFNGFDFRNLQGARASKQ